MLGLELGSLARRSVSSAMGRKVLAEFDPQLVARWLDLFASMFLPLCGPCSLRFQLLAISEPGNSTPDYRPPTVTHGNPR